VIEGDEWFMIRQLFREGLTISEIARRTGRDRKTVRKAINSEWQPAYRQRPTVASKLDPYKDYVRRRMEAGMTNAVKMHREIKARGYDGEITAQAIHATAQLLRYHTSRAGVKLTLKLLPVPTLMRCERKIAFTPLESRALRSCTCKFCK